jgi:lipopolysaccharide export LptBFGC system permease protein LptF
MAEKGNHGIIGSFLFAVGATMVLFISMVILGAMFHGSDQNPIIPPTIVFCFIGFLLVGVGLWLIQGKR